MDTKLHDLKRPPKLPYFPDKGRSSKQWTRLRFEDLDSNSSDDQPPLSPVLCAQPSSEKRQAAWATSPVLQLVRLPGKQPRNSLSSQKVPKNEAMRPAVRPEIPVLDRNMDIPFKDHGPNATSSPIGAEGDAEDADCQEVSPVLFACDEDVQERMKREPPPPQKPPCNGHTTQRSDDACWLESPPNNFVLSKSKTFTPSRTVLRQENSGPPVSAVTPEPERTARVKGSESERKQAEKHKLPRMSVFLQTLKLKEPGLPTPARKPLPPEVPIPPELDDDFMILEDHAPTRFSFSSKFKHNRSRTSSNDEGESTDNGAKDAQPGKAENHPSPGEAEIRSAEEPLKSESQPRKRASAESGDAERSAKNTEEKEKGRSKDGDENLWNRRVKVVKKSRGRVQGSGASEEPLPAEAAKEPSCEDHDPPPPEQEATPAPEATKPRRQRKAATTTKAPASVETKQSKASRGSDAPQEEQEAPGKRRRNKPGHWWMCSPQSTEEEEEEETDVKRRLQKATAHSPVQNRHARDAEERDRRPSSTQAAEIRSAEEPLAGQRKTKEKTAQQTAVSRVPVSMPSKATPGVKAKGSEPDAAVEAAVFSSQEDRRNVKKPKSVSSDDKAESQPRKRAINRTKKRQTHGETFDIVPSPPARASPERSPDRASPERSPDRSKSPVPQKRTRRSEPNGPSSTQANPKTKRHKSLSLAGPQAGDAAKPRVIETPNPQPKQKPRVPPKSVRTSMATFKEIFNPATETPVVASRSRKTGCKALFRVQEEGCNPVNGAGGLIAADCAPEPASESESPVVFMELAGERRNTVILSSSSRLDDLQESRQLSDNTLNTFKSGAVSMLELKEYEGNESLSPLLPSSKVRPVLTELCSHPLIPMELRADDRANVSEWLKVIWPATEADSNGTHVSADRFDWYTYRTRFLGVMVDLRYDSLCNGKLLLGSYTKKPLWVDHSATSVFNILRGGVSVIINGLESSYSPGQCFLAPCGHAYSIQNQDCEPAVLYFTRMVAECPE